MVPRVGQEIHPLLGRGGLEHLVSAEPERARGEGADRVLVLHRGQLLADGRPGSIFARTDVMEKASLSPPPITELSQRLSHMGMPGDATNVDAFVASYTALLPDAQEGES